LRTEKRLTVMILLGLLTSIILSVGAIRDFSGGELALAGKRITGVLGNLFENPNDLALYLVTFFPILIGLALGTRNPFSKVLYLVSAILLLGGTVVTFSRGGFIGLLFVTGTLVWRLGKKNRFLIGVVAVILLTCFLALAPGAYRERITSTDASSESRTGELKRSIFLTLRHPLFGVGLDNFVLYSNTAHATHNAYTQVASEVGLPAAVVYVLFLVAAVKRVRKVPDPHDLESKEKWFGYLAIGLHASLIGYMVTSFFASVAFLWYVYYLAAYVIAIDRLNENSYRLDGPKYLSNVTLAESHESSI